MTLGKHGKQNCLVMPIQPATPLIHHVILARSHLSQATPLICHMMLTRSHLSQATPPVHHVMLTRHITSQEKENTVMHVCVVSCVLLESFACFTLYC